MKKINKFLCIPLIIACITSILFMYNLSCGSDVFEMNFQIFLLSIFSFITILIGISTDSTYIIREKFNKRGKK